MHAMKFEHPPFVFHGIVSRHLVVIYPGARAYSLAQRVSVMPLARLAQARQDDLSTWGTIR